MRAPRIPEPTALWRASAPRSAGWWAAAAVLTGIPRTAGAPFKCLRTSSKVGIFAFVTLVALILDE
eukprot:6254105-Pyramimonas_sp.AAC.1